MARRRKEYTLLSHNDMLAVSRAETGISVFVWCLSGQKMKSAIQEDDAIDARALLLAGLDVDSTFAENVTVEGYPIQAGSILLHWAVAYDALECTKVRDVTPAELHPSYRTGRRSCNSLFLCLLGNFGCIVSAVANACTDFEG